MTASYDVLVVGAGFAGSVVAERLASTAGAFTPELKNMMRAVGTGASGSSWTVLLSQEASGAAQSSTARARGRFMERVTVW